MGAPNASGVAKIAIIDECMAIGSMTARSTIDGRRCSSI